MFRLEQDKTFIKMECKFIYNFSATRNAPETASMPHAAPLLADFAQSPRSESLARRFCLIVAQCFHSEHPLGAGALQGQTA